MKTTAFILLVVFFFVLFFSSFENRSPSNTEIDQIRNIFLAFEKTHGDVEKTRALHDSIKTIISKQENNAHIAYALETMAEFSEKYLSDTAAIHFLEATIEKPEFKNQHYLNKYYVQYYLALEYAEIQNINKAIERAHVADSIVENRDENHDAEKKLIKELVSRTSNTLFNMEDVEIEKLKEELVEMKKGKNETSTFCTMKKSYNIAFYNNKIGNYKESQEWIGKTKKIAEKLNDKNYLSKIEFLQTKNLRKLGKENLILELYRKYQQQHKERTLADDEYVTKMNAILVESIGLLSDEEIIRNTDLITKYFQPKSCVEYNHLGMIYKTRANVFQKLNDAEMEMKSLENMLENYKDCDEKDQYNVYEEQESLSRLIMLKVNQNDLSNLEYYNNRKQNIDNTITQNKLQYSSFSLKLMRNNLNHLDQQTKNLEAIRSLQTKENYIYLFLILVLVPAAIISFIILRKNKKIKKSISKNYKILRNNNHTINDTKKELEVLVETLESRNNNLENFAKNAAQDIASPLNVLENSLDKISDKYERIIEDSDKEIFTYIHHSTESLNNMITVLLEYSKKDKKINKSEELSLVNTIGEVKNRIKEMAKEKWAEIRLMGEDTTIYSNKDLLMQVFQNLMVNALKFHKSAHAPKIDIYIQRLGNNRVQLVFEDNGIGIAKENLDEIFQIFKKLDTKDEFEGNGIGLSTCRNIINELGGKIWAESEYGYGSKFFIELPIKPCENMEINYYSENEKVYAG